MNKLYTYGDLVLEAGLDDMAVDEWCATESPERLESIDWNDERPSIAYLQARYDECYERYARAMNDYTVIARWRLDIPERLQKWVHETRADMHRAYKQLRERANDE